MSEHTTEQQAADVESTTDGGEATKQATGIRKYEAAIVGVLVGVVSAVGFGVLVMML